MDFVSLSINLFYVECFRLLGLIVTALLNFPMFLVLLYHIFVYAKYMNEYTYTVFLITITISHLLFLYRP